MEQIEIEFVIDESVIKKTYSELLRRNKLFVYLPWLFFIWLVIALVFYVNAQSFALWHYLILLLLLSPIVGSFVFYKVFVLRQWINELKDRGDFPGKARMIFTANSINSYGSLVNGITGWDVFNTIAFGKYIIIGTVEPNLIQAIPYHAFTEEELQQFKLWAKANVKRVII